MTITQMTPSRGRQFNRTAQRRQARAVRPQSERRESIMLLATNFTNYGM